MTSLAYPLIKPSYFQRLKALGKHVSDLRIRRPVLQGGRYICRVEFRINGQPIALNAHVSKALVDQAKRWAHRKVAGAKAWLKQKERDVGFAGIDWEAGPYERASTDPWSQSPSVFGGEDDGDDLFSEVSTTRMLQGYYDDEDAFGDSIRSVKNTSGYQGEVQSGSAASYDYNPYLNPYGGSGYAPQLDPYAGYGYAPPAAYAPYIYQAAAAYGVPEYAPAAYNPYAAYMSAWPYFAGEDDDDGDVEEAEEWAALYGDSVFGGMWAEEGYDDFGDEIGCGGAKFCDDDEIAGIWEAMDPVMNVIGDIASNPVVAGAISAIPYGALVVAGVNATVAGYKITRHYTSDKLRKKQAQLKKAEAAAKAGGNAQKAMAAQKEQKKIAAIDAKLKKLKADAKQGKPAAVKAVADIKVAAAADTLRKKALAGDKGAIKWMSKVRAGVNKKDPKALGMYALLEKLQGSEPATPSFKNIQAAVMEADVDEVYDYEDEGYEDDEEGLYEDDMLEFAGLDEAPIEVYYNADTGFGDAMPSIANQIIGVAQQAAQIAPSIFQLTTFMDEILAKLNVGSPQEAFKQAITAWDVRPVTEAIDAVAKDKKAANTQKQLLRYVKAKNPKAAKALETSLKAAAAAKDTASPISAGKNQKAIGDLVKYMRASGKGGAANILLAAAQGKPVTAKPAMPGGQAANQALAVAHATGAMQFLDAALG